MLSLSPSHVGGTPQVERRAEPRKQLGYRALVRLQNKLTFPATVRDLSSAAAQIVCNSRYGLLIDPSGRGDKLPELPAVELAFAMFPIDFRARCRIKYVRTVSTTSSVPSMLFGFKFLGVDFSMLQKLESILEPELAFSEPATIPTCR